ncbi:MAG: chromate transporter [Treponema sp.]|nr:chromate transporter [Treponema sp.]
MSAPTLLELFCIFFYIGLFTIGGGLVAITSMQQIVVGRGWITSEKFFNMVAISESTPGPIGVNMATYIGYEFHGTFGGIVATLGEILPSYICIILIAKFFARFQEKPVVKAAFKTLRPATSGIVLVACAQVFALALLNLSALAGGAAFSLKALSGLVKWKSAAFYAAAVLALFFTKVHPIAIVLAGALFGIVFL